MMPENFLTFQKFNDPALADSMCVLLRSQGIDCKVVNEAPVFDVSFAHNQIDPTYHLKLPSGDFVRARAALETYYAQQLNTLDPDYYLLSFSDDELLDIIRHPDEWGALDHALARQLLAKHGKPVTPEQEAAVREDRLAELSNTATEQTRWIFFAYLLAIVFGLGGFFLGYAMVCSKKNLPNGDQVFVYSPKDRRHGRRVMVISAITFAYWLWVILAGAESLAPWSTPS
ncbi:MAG TPA: hypothetical protein VHE54_11985 [Puia sp.]|nr:hypothetical protein [Puia sp.]